MTYEFYDLIYLVYGKVGDAGYHIGYVEKLLRIDGI